MSKSTIGTKARAGGKPAGRSQPGAGPATVPTNPADIRNVVVVGHSGAGKTTLVEHLMVASGALNRAGSIAEGNTFSDSEPVEVSQQRSVFLSACPLNWKGVTLNLLDTPGFLDFVAELRAGMRAADAALFVVSATDLLDDTTLALWEECAALALPRAIVVTRLDVPRADFESALDVVREAFGTIGGNAVVAMTRPVHENAAVVRLLGDDDGGAFAAHRGALIEAIIAESEDETLLESYLGGADLDEATLWADLHVAVSRGHLHPVLPVSAVTGLGLEELLDFIVDALPSPQERPLPSAWTPAGAPGPALACDPQGPLAAEVVRTWSDQYVGRVSLVRVFSGSLRGDTPLHVTGRGNVAWGHPDHDVEEKAPLLQSTSAEPVEEVGAGNLCLVARLAGAETGDTLCEHARPLVILPWSLPAPTLPIAVAASNDEEHLAAALERLAIADPAVHVERNITTGQLVLWCLGEAHADVVLSRLRAAGAAVTTEPVRVALRATLAGSADGHGRHVKQSGGHGQYAVCAISVEPLPRDSGIEFVDKVVGGAVPHQFIPSVEKGVRAQLGQNDPPISDVRVTLTDGKAHSVDSSDAAFQVAGALAIKDAVAKGGLQILEPIEAADVLVNDSYIGAVLSDLSGRRARVTGTEPVESSRPGGRSVIHAEVPSIELVRYTAALRSLTGGAGSFTRSYLRHDRAPEQVARALVPGT